MSLFSRYEKLLAALTVLFIAAIFINYNIEQSASPPAAATLSDGIYVKVSGEVKSPGVYTLKGEITPELAIEAAGGLTELADPNSLDMARDLGSGIEVYVPAKKEEKTGAININTATLDELCTLPSIGEVTGKKIIDFRLKNGPFKDTKDIVLVSGIGEKTYEKIKDLITV